MLVGELLLKKFLYIYLLLVMSICLNLNFIYNVLPVCLRDCMKSNFKIKMNLTEIVFSKAFKMFVIQCFMKRFNEI